MVNRTREGGRLSKNTHTYTHTHTYRLYTLIPIFDPLSYPMSKRSKCSSSRNVQKSMSVDTAPGSAGHQWLRWMWVEKIRLLIQTVTTIRRQVSTEKACGEGRAEAVKIITIIFLKVLQVLKAWRQSCPAPQRHRDLHDSSTCPRSKWARERRGEERKPTRTLVKS